MEYTVYILFSERLGRYYVGSTKDLNRRMTEHNSGKGVYTSKGMPWLCVHTIQTADRATAVKLELQIKKRGIQRYLKDNDLDTGSGRSAAR